MPPWMLMLLLAAPPSALDQAGRALAEFRVEEALKHLERARDEGPHRYRDHVRLYELIGIAHAYLDKKDVALEAFDALLALDPGHALSYTLSPKVTFLFQQARKLSGQRPPATVDLSWPRDLKVSDPVPIDIEVVSDPKGFLNRAKLHARRKGTIRYSVTPVTLSGAGQYQRVELPPTHPDASQAEVLQLYLVVTDQAGNEVLLLGSPERPREISLAFEEPEPWYRRWWVWAIVGGVVAAGTGTAVYILLQDPPDNVGGIFSVPR